MDIKNVSIDAVIPYARNPRLNKEAVSKVAGSIKEYGFRQPIVVDEQMVIVAGHTRLLAAQQLGLEEVPIHIATGLTDAQIKAYRLADNKTAEFAEWDEELLALELEELQKQGIDLDLTAFDSIDIDRLLATLEDDDMVSAEEFAPEITGDPITKTGDIWQLGNHRLFCGDATDGVGIPLGEESELYEVEILNGASVVRNIETTSPTATYSATDQVVDFGSTQSSITVKIYQMSAVVGRGYAASATI